MDGIRTSLSGIRAGEMRLSAAASNIARAVVPGAKPVRVEAASVPEGGVEARMSTAAGDSIELSREAVELLRSKHDVATNARALRRIDDTHDALLEMLDRD